MSQIQTSFGRSLEIPSEVKRIFVKVALKAKLFSFIGFPQSLLDLDQVKKWMGLVGQQGYGTRPVNLTQVVGATGCCHEFDRAFRPKSDKNLRKDWEAIATLTLNTAIPLTTELYQFGEAYFATSRFGAILVSVLRAFDYKKFQADVVGPTDAGIPRPTIEYIEFWENEVQKECKQSYK